MSEEKLPDPVKLPAEPPAPITPPSGPSVLLMGEMTSGKTESVKSLVKLGFEVFYLPLEPGYLDTLGPIADQIHIHYIPAFGGKEDVKEGHSFDVLLDTAKLINTTSHDTIQKMGGSNKQNHQQFFDLVSTLNNFIDDRTGESFGDVAMWECNRVLFVDGLSGISEMAKRLTIGDKPFMELRDYSAVQHIIRQLVNGLCSRTRAMFVLAAHLERETDPNTSAIRLMVSTPGKALAPEVPRFFSDSIHCKVEVKGGVPVWSWNTLPGEVTTKARNLPLANGLAPNFEQLVGNWRKRVGITK